MRILYFLAHPYGVGGAQKQMVIQAKMMLNAGHSVLVIIQNDRDGLHGNEIEKLIQSEGIDYKAAYYPISICMESIDILESLSTFNNVKRIIESFSPNIIHSCQLNIAVELAAQTLGICHVMSVYPVDDATFNIKWLDIIPHNHICDSEYYCKKWRHGLGLYSECIRVACAPSKEGVKKLNDSINLICVGKFGEYKQQLLVIKLIEKYANSKLKINLKFLGLDECVYGRYCREYTALHGLEDCVEFVGHVSDINPYYEWADCLIHASKTESYPGVIAEAMSKQVVVITAPAGGIPEIVIDGYNGFLADGFDLINIERAFIRYLRERFNGELSSVIKKGYETYKSFHSMKRISEKLLFTYDNFIKRNNLTNVDVDEIKVVFNTFSKEKEILSCRDIIKADIWYLYHIDRMLKKYNKTSVMIWGAGVLGGIALEWCRILELTVKGFIDTYKRGYKEGYKVNSPNEKCISDADIILVAVTDVNAIEEIMGVIEAYDKKRNVDYFLMKNNPCLKPRLKV